MKSAESVFVVLTFGYGGHVPTYHNLFVRGVLRGGGEVVSACGWNHEVRAAAERWQANGLKTDRLKTPEIACLKTEIAARSAFRFLNWLPMRDRVWMCLREVGFLRTRRARRRWRGTIEAIQAISAMYPGRKLHVLLTYIDEFIAPGVTPHDVDRLMPCEWSCFYINAERNDLTHQQRVRRARWEQFLRAKNCRAIGVLDADSARLLQENTGVGNVVIFPDVVDITDPLPDEPIANEIRQRAGLRTVVGLVGQITPRKNLDLFVDLTRACDPKRYFFAMVGECERMQFPKQVREWIGRGERGEISNVFVSANRISGDGAFNAVCSSLDVVFAAYKDFRGSSNIIGKAAAFRKPILVGQGHQMEQIVKRWGTGLAFNERSVADALSALKVLAGEETRSGYDLIFDYAGYLHSISIEAFEHSVFRTVGLRSN